MVEAKSQHEEAQRLEAKAKEREAEILECEQKAKNDAEQARLDADLARANSAGCAQTRARSKCRRVKANRRGAEGRRRHPRA